MRLIRTLSRNRPRPDPSALVIGNFDGCHLGHQALIKRMHALAGTQGLVPAMMCFEPLPVTFFNPNSPVARLMSVRDKIQRVQKLGVQQLLMLRFHKSFSMLSPEEFVTEAIIQGAGASEVIVGEDFRFGHRAVGDVELLTALGKRHGFEVHPISAVQAFGERISSTRVREMLAAGDLEGAQTLLGRPYTISSRVLRGQQLGRELGYPTVNLRPPVPPALHGIFAVRVSASSNVGIQGHPGVASLGMRPMVDGRDWLLEVHLFDYDGQLYGEHLSVEFVGFVREEKTFESLDAMTEEMHRDAVKARAMLGNDQRAKT